MRAMLMRASKRAVRNLDGCGTIQSFGRAGLQAMIGTIVDDKRLGNAVALDSISLVWPRIAAPALGGVLVGPLGVGALFWMTAAGQLITFITLLLIRWEPQDMKAAKESVGSNVLEALRHVRGETVMDELRGLAIDEPETRCGRTANFLLDTYNLLSPTSIMRAFQSGEPSAPPLCTLIGGCNDESPDD